MSKTCSTCQKWLSAGSTAGYGTCKAISKTSMATVISNSNKARIGDGLTDLYTGKDFGCLLHEEKPREFKVGDKVCWRSAKYSPCRVKYKIVVLFTHDDIAKAVLQPVGNPRYLYIYSVDELERDE